jgi:hypothetical protein
MIGGLLCELGVVSSFHPHCYQLIMAWANPPPPLAIPSHRPPSPDSEGSSRSPSPVFAGLDSSSALILVHDSDDSNTPFDFTSDDEDDGTSPRFEARRASIPPLGPSIVFMYLLSPYLKLGAFFLPHTMLPLKHGLPSFLVFAGLSAFARQIWYNLARYMRTVDLEDVILDAFARGRGKEHRRSILRSTVRAGTSSLRVLLGAIYLRRESMDISSPPSSDSFVAFLLKGLPVYCFLCYPTQPLHPPGLH